MSHLKEFQYKDSTNFNERISLHYRFGTNKYLWPLWVFDNINKADNLKVLELGCGNGLLWRLNANRVPESWDIILSDFSEGMLKAAKNLIGDDINHIKYEIIDIENIPYEDYSYDIIIANHMLYHVPSRTKALAEIRRVLKNDGIFYATTISCEYMKELRELIKEYRSKPYNEGEAHPVISNFSIENGDGQLKEYFNRVELKIYDNSLIINDAQSFINYAYSCNGMSEGKIILDESERNMFHKFVEEKINTDGNIIIPSKFGMFISRNI